MSSHEFAEWAAYLSVEPQGEDRDDLRFALLQATTVNIHRPKNKSPLTAKNFLHDFWIERPVQSWEEQLTFMRGWYRATYKKEAPTGPSREDARAAKKQEAEKTLS